MVVVEYGKNENVDLVGRETADVEVVELENTTADVEVEGSANVKLAGFADTVAVVLELESSISKEFLAPRFGNVDVDVKPQILTSFSYVESVEFTTLMPVFLINNLSSCRSSFKKRYANKALRTYNKNCIVHQLCEIILS